MKELLAATRITVVTMVTATITLALQQTVAHQLPLTKQVLVGDLVFALLLDFLLALFIATVQCLHRLHSSHCHLPHQAHGHGEEKDILVNNHARSTIPIAFAPNAHAVTSCL